MNKILNEFKILGRSTAAMVVRIRKNKEKNTKRIFHAKAQSRKEERSFMHKKETLD